MKEILSYILGDNPSSFYAAWYMLALLGLSINMVISYTNRGNNTKFNLMYLLQDTKWDLLIWLLLTFVVGRFLNDILSLVMLSSNISPMFIAFCWGFLNSTILRYIRTTNFGRFIKLPTKADGKPRV